MTNGIGLYLHIPFCIHRCSYCDFFSLTDGSPDKFGVLVDRLVDDFTRARRWWEENRQDIPRARTIFFGGGTPSLLPAPLLERVLDALRNSFPWEPEAEVTVEANPESLSREWLRTARGAGVNRVSLGAQSLLERHLKTLERLATPASVRRAAALLREEGWNRFNLDLIFGIPGQTVDEMLQDIEGICDLGGDHVSFYQLTLTRGHVLHSRLPDGDRGAELYERGCSALHARGMFRYETSNFARPGGECRHNQGYWQGRDYLGFGPSAASRIFHEGTFWHGKLPADWGRYQKEREWKWEPSSLFQTRLEAVYLGLRTREGLAHADLSGKFGLDLRHHPKALRFRDEGLLQWDEERLQVTPRGGLLVDALAPELVDELR